MASIKTPGCSHNGRPTITLSYAQSLDGSIAMDRGVPYALSGSESQTLTHRIRAAHDAILVGINTIISDNPYLTVRLVEGKNPLPIVLDSSLRLPLNSNLLKNDLRPLIATTASASQERQTKLEKSGAKIIRTMSDEKGWVDLHSMLSILVDLGINNIMVEGGARVITSFLTQHLVDWLVITIAPRFLGGLHALEYPLTSHDPNGKAGFSSLPNLYNSKYEQVGEDLVFWSAISWATV